MPFIVIVFILFIVLAIVVYTLKTKQDVYTAPTSKMLTSEDYNKMYSIPSMWTETKPYNSSKCLAYTFVGSNDAQAVPSYGALNSCIATGTCSIGITQNCIDDDQLLAQQVSHKCQYGKLKDIPITQYKGCMTWDGRYVKDDTYVETFYQRCSNKQTPANKTITKTTSQSSSRCPGSIALLTFGWNQSDLTTTSCLVDPIYSYDEYKRVVVDPHAPVRVDFCSMGANQNGFPSQLFRIQNSSFDGKSFKNDQSGRFMKIVHRPSGLCLSPDVWVNDKLDFNSPSNDGSKPPILVDCESLSSKGFWWTVSTPLMKDVGTPEQKNSNIYLVYVPDATKIKSYKDEDLWTYFTTTNTSVVVTTNEDKTSLGTVPFITYTASSGDTDTDRVKSLRATFQYIDYALLKMIKADPRVFQ